jgi:hypothetical protein
MTVASEQTPPARELVDVRTQIAALYATYSLAIADSLGERPLCVVTGPRRFGKTTSLLPGVADILRARGYSTHAVNGRDYEEEPFTADTLPPGRVDVLIIDEANVLTRSKKKTTEILRLLHENGCAVVSAITYHAGYESGALSLGRIWQAAESSISGQVANIVRLPQMVVTPLLARELLTLYSPVRNEAVRARIVTYIVERVPLNPHVLLDLAGARSITEANEIVRHRKSTRFQGALSPDEYTLLEQSLAEPG